LKISVLQHLLFLIIANKIGETSVNFIEFSGLKKGK